MADADTKERVVALIAGVLKLDKPEVDNLRLDAGYQRIAKWTSARHAEIIVALEDEFGIEVEERAIARLNDVAAICRYLEEHGAAS